MQLFTLLFLTILSRANTQYICYKGSNCEYQHPTETLSSTYPKCCQLGAKSYTTILDGQDIHNCTLCDFVLNLSIIPTEQFYRANIPYTPYGGQLILTFPIEINAFYTAIRSNTKLPNDFITPLDSLITVSYSEGTGEAIEYSRITQASGSLYGGLIDRDQYNLLDIPSGKFIPVVRTESYNGTIVIQASYLLSEVQTEVSYAFIVLECLDCLNSGYPNSECSQCICTDGFTGKLCQGAYNTSIMYCNNTTCLNNGVCNGSIVCDCDHTGFDGDFCQFDVNECLLETHNCTGSSSCHNLYGDFTCICHEGFTGVNCDINIDTCALVYCTHHSTCQNVAGDAICVCDVGYTGVDCLVSFSVCDYSECSVNTSLCIESVPDSTNYTCICKSGYEGRFCTLDIDECKNEPCLTGETCMNTFGGFECVCEIENCEIIDGYDSGGLIGLGIALILVVLIFGFGLIGFWVAILVYKYLKRVRSSARYIMVRKFEKEANTAWRIRKRKKHINEKQKNDIEMTSAVFENSYSKDETDNITSTL
ncbi:hypothetical protein LOD99_8694 [Oopsacas minuta]|uniref:EGF-like domain-containing protein n=1 Tax=Oopsacas minuta TaxID=111878 RepID=A0AAV7JFU1_9METZ|nr:hypothetical protein LOD99_8694 [Oopsacas minuta]